jgi:cytochrome b6-f complex iron-sulfur subunit
MDNEQSSIGRRALLCGAIALVVGVSTDIASAAVAGQGIKQRKDGKIDIDLSKNPALKKVGGAITIDLADGSSVAVVRTTAGVKGLTVLNLSCTHNGVTVMQQGSQWLCPAHGSQFSLAGKVLQGPARTALYKYPSTATLKTLTIG